MDKTALINIFTENDKTIFYPELTHRLRIGPGKIGHRRTL